MQMIRVLTIVAIFGVCVLASGAALGDTRGAILIGVDQYVQEGQIPPLQSASSDARELGQILSQNGYECRVMVDEGATKDQITEAFIQMEQQVSQAGQLDVFLFYFSGRGARIPDDIQSDETQDDLDECILPSDAIAGNLRSYIRDDVLARWISAIRAKQVILILDCAFWGADANPNVKGLGGLEEAETPDAVEIADGLPVDTVIISAGSPDTGVQDGVFTPKFLESCVTEEADGDGDRVISFAEAHQFALRQLQERQPPRIVGSKAADIPFAPLPPLSRINIDSEPPQAEVLLYRDSQKLELGETEPTPVIIPLRKGTYRIQARKNGFLMPEAKKAAIMEYNTLYVVDVFQLEPIKVVGQVSVINSEGESISVADGLLTVHIRRDDKEIHQEALSGDGKFQLAPADHDWLTVDAEYEFRITGRPVLSADPVRFTYAGYSDVDASVTVALDDIPPILFSTGVRFQSTRLVLGEETRGSVQAKDDGLGMMDAIDIQFQPPNAAETVSIPASSIRFQSPGVYEFSYAVPDASSSVGEWSIAVMTLKDKAGNETDLSGDQIGAKFHIFASRLDLGRYYFDAGDHAKALDHFGRVDPPTDDAHYFSALSHYSQNDLANALASFQKVEDKTRYLGQGRPKEIPQMPRKMVNRIWGELLDNVNANSKDASYLELLAITAEELGRSYEAKIYHERAKSLR